MKADTLRGKVKRYMEEEQISLRTLAQEAKIPASTLCEFLAGKYELSKRPMRRLARAVDPFKQDLAVRAAEFFRMLKRSEHDENEIAIIGEHLMKMVKKS